MLISGLRWLMGADYRREIVTNLLRQSERGQPEFVRPERANSMLENADLGQILRVKELDWVKEG